jgi:hypothetical protein
MFSSPLFGMFDGIPTLTLTAHPGAFFFAQDQSFN